MSKLRRPIVLAVAPVCHVGGHLPSGVTNPLTPEEVAVEAIACCRAGASVVHLHVRDRQGEIVGDLDLFGKTLDLILAETDPIINVSTGGVSTLSLEERCVGLNEPRVSIGSLNMGSTNFGDNVYINTVPDIRFWAGRMAVAGVVPELEIFNPSMIETAWKLKDEGVLGDPMLYNFALGFDGALGATSQNLFRLSQMLPQGSVFGVVHEGMEDFALLASAIGLGATVLRVGFEDGGYLAPDRPAKTNAELVAALAQLIEICGCRPASIAESRELLGLG